MLYRRKRIVEGKDEESYASEFADTKDDKKDDDDDNYDDHDDHALIKNRVSGSLEIRTEKMQTPIPSPPRSPRKYLSSDKAIDQELTNYRVFLRLFEKSSASFGSCRDDAFRKRDHDNDQRDDAPHEMEKKRQQQQQDWDAWVDDQVVDEDEEDLKHPKPNSLIFYGLQRDLNEPPRVTTEQQHILDFMEQIIMIRENDKSDSFSEADFKYLKKNDIEDIHYLYLNKKVHYCEKKLLNSLLTFINSCVIWERVHDFQLGIESYHIKINLTAPT
nr:hypothetical protein [Tanacetum cinerariifolium]